MTDKAELQRNASKIALAGLLTVSLCGAGLLGGGTSSPAYAGEVVVNKTANESTAQTLSYKAFKLFDATKNADGSISDITWANNDVKTAVEGVIKAEDNTYTGTTAQAAAEWITKHVTGTDATTIVDSESIANKIAKAVDDLTATETLTSGESKVLANGYWLFVADTNTTAGKENLAGTSPIFAVVGDDALNITPKTGTPTVDKTIKSDATGEFGKVADSQIGQIVEYKLVGTVASNIATYDTYSYTFTDTLSNGLDLTGTNDVKVTIGDTDVTKAAKISFANKVLTVSFDNLLAEEVGAPITAVSTVTVTYKAKLTADAIIGGTGNENAVKLVYSNNPNTTSTGTTTPSTVRDYTYKLHLVKSDKATNEKLQGAKFTIQATNPDDVTSQNLYVQENGTLGTEPYEFETNANGVIDIAGLDAGTYTVTETAVPQTDSNDTKYKKAQPFTFTIAPSYGTDADVQALANLAFTVEGANVIAGLDTTDDNMLNADANSAVVPADGLVNVTVANEKTIKMPLTGQQGIALAVGAGLVIVIASVASLNRRRREND